jgi:hypothetical protein
MRPGQNKKNIPTAKPMQDPAQLQPRLELNDNSTYFARRMHQLGVLPEHNAINLATPLRNPKTLAEEIEVPIFREGPKGIDILVYDINGYVKRETVKMERRDETVLASGKPYMITRLEHPKVRADGSVQKYDKPYKQPSHPFFPPGLVYHYRKCVEWKEKNPGDELPVRLRIKALYVTEGFFKAFKADMHRIWCIGLQSITCMRDKRNNQLWEDIRILVQVCEVERLIWLTDGDFMNITSKDLTEGIDLYKRPNIFYNSAQDFKEFTSSLECDKYFAHINSDTLAGSPKGLDDMLCAFPDDLKKIVDEFNNFSIMAPGKAYPGTFITRVNITVSTGYLRQYILHESPTHFYLYHLTRRPELKDLKTFKYNGTTYHYDEKKGQCEVEIPGDASLYIRMGNDYYKKIVVPDKKGKEMSILAPRLKSTIVDDYGREFINHIKKYEAPCIVPDHFNHQPAVHNCYNLYNPFVHQPEEGDYSNTLAFFKHIFSEELVKYKDKETGEVHHIPRYELGLDYYTIMYKYPCQILPILCCVSRERQTGKTTLHDYTDELFKGNSINIGNEDLEADFNAHWAGKLVIKVDETKVEKGRVVDKVKRLSTASNIIMNAKGKDQTTLPFFAKFMLNSNHVEDFIRIDKEEIRFWIHQVKPIPNLQPNFLETLIEEIPAFLYYLNTRNMVTKRVERHWFDSQLLHTEALQRIKENSLPTIERRIRQELQEIFELCSDEILYYPLDALVKAVLNENPNNKIYIKRILTDMNIENIHSLRGKYARKTEINNTNLGYPNTKELGLDWCNFNTSCYKFHRKDFATDGTTNNEHLLQSNDGIKNDLPF